jgi:anaerobic selenocysteine-containing dehydrogenase
MRATQSDFEQSRLIVVWGANPATDSPPIDMRRITQARRRGARVIAIDHMRSDIAARADQWIPIRPGTDGALALAMMNVIIGENLYDAEFVSNWTVGFGELAEYVKQFPPSRASEITGVPSDVIVETARAIATMKNASFSMYTGLEYTNSGTQNIRAVYCLWAITGNLDVPGGLLFRLNKRVAGRRDLVQPSEPKPIGYDKYPYFCELTKRAQFMEAPRAILHDDPYPLRALILNGSSILTSYPNTNLWRECLSKLDLLVVMDRFQTADCAYADYVLPATTYYENSSYQRYPSGYAQLRQRVIDPVGEARSDHFFCADLARRLGYGHLFPQNDEDLLEFAFKDLPGSLSRLRENPAGLQIETFPTEYRKYEKGMLRPDGKPGFNTASGKVELASSLLARYGYDALPVYVEPVEGPASDPELAKRYPLILNTGARLHSTFRSQHLNIPGLLKMQPEPEVIMNTEDAAARGIGDGDRVYVETSRGRVPYTARVTGGIVKGAVEVNVGGGGPLQPPAWREANTNFLTDDQNRDPISGFPVFKALLCQVTRA